MPLGIGKLLKAQMERPRPMWILGYRTVGSRSLPVVYYKRTWGEWQVVYLGEDVPSNHSVVFNQGVRNPLDPKGVISVSCSYSLTGDDDYELRNQRRWARSADGGVTWSYPGIATTNTDVASEAVTHDSAQSLYSSPDDQIISTYICSPAPGLICFSGKKRIGTKRTQFETWYEYDLTVLTSTNGGALTPSSQVMPITRYDDDYDFNQGAFYPLAFDWLGIARGADPSPLYGMRDKTAAQQYVGVMQLRIRDAELSQFVSVQYYLTIDAAGVGGAITPMPFGPVSQSVGFTTMTWDGDKYYFGGRQPAGTQALFSAESLDGPWTEIYQGGTAIFGASAARRRGYLVVSGKGTTTDGGQTWESFGQTFKAVGWFGMRFYGITDTQLYSSRDGITWTAETLPTVTGLQMLMDIFGG